MSAKSSLWRHVSLWERRKPSWRFYWAYSLCLTCGASVTASFACAPRPAPTQFVPEAQPSSPVTTVGATKNRLIILGFDGLDPRQVRRLMAAQALPHMAALAVGGHQGPLGTTNPPESPVAWAAFATGATAGEHGIFDFVGRDSQTYLPKVATTHVQAASFADGQLVVASATNLRRGEAFWDVIARSGVPVCALQVPYAYPPPPDGARQLAGLGTPDVRGTNSEFVYVTDDAHKWAAQPPAGGRWLRLESLTPPGGPKPQAWRAMLEGPRVHVEGVASTPWIPLTVTQAPYDTVVVELGQHKVNLRPGETSSYVQLEFVAAPAFKIQAGTRVTLKRLRPAPELYIEPLSILPEKPYLPLSVPPHYAFALWQGLGPFKTVGWVDDTSALGAGVIDEAQFLREAMATLAWQQAALLAALDEHDDRLVVAVMTAPDRIAHMFFRAVDRHSLQHAAARPFADAIDAVYRACDGVVGAVMGRLSPEDILMVISDHGFAGFRRGFNLNRWLIAQGYMHLHPGAQVGRPFFADVAWDKTSAYALGTGGIYLNVQGREAQGIVPAAQAGKVAQKLAHALLGLKDGATLAVLSTYLGDNLYAGPARADAPDVRVGLADGYRASWATTLGAAPLAVFETNTKKWTGDHASARPEDVPGILLSNRPIAMPAPRIEDLARTAYDFTKVNAPPTVVGRNLLQAAEPPENAPGEF